MKKIFKIRDNLEEIIIKYFRKIFWGIINYSDRKRLKNENFTILCANCIGGVLYSRLKCAFLTPTINMWMEDSDLIKFAADLEKYIQNSKLYFIKGNYDYPVAILNDITLHFNHCKTDEEAIIHWNKRINRINKENMFIIISDRCGLSEENIQRLEKIVCKGKVLFTVQKDNLKDYMLYLPYYEGNKNIGIYMEDRLKNKFGIAPFDGYFDYVHFFNTGEIVKYKGIKAMIIKMMGKNRYESKSKCCDTGL